MFYIFAHCVLNGCSLVNSRINYSEYAMHWKNNYNNNTCKNTKYLRNSLNYSLKKTLLLPNSVLFLPNFGSIVFCSSSNLHLNQSIIFLSLRFKRYLLGLSGTFSILRLTSSALNLQLCSGEKKEKVWQ